MDSRFFSFHFTNQKLMVDLRLVNNEYRKEEGKLPTARISTYHQLWIHKLMMVLEISAVG